MINRPQPDQPDQPTNRTRGNFSWNSSPIQTAEASEIADGEPILFDTVITNETTAITYNPVNGEFTISEEGVYYFDFWIAVDTAATATTITFELEGSDGTSILTSSSNTAQTLSGNALVNVTTVPSTFRLLNQSGDTAFIPALPAQANMTIIHLEQ